MLTRACVVKNKDGLCGEDDVVYCMEYETKTCAEKIK